MFQRLFRRLFFTVILTVLVLLPIRIVLNQALGLILKRVFAQGTDCEVKLKRPRLYFFPISAAVSDVIIRHRSEGPDEGFRAKRVSIGLEFTKLFRKELLLKDLHLEGAQALSTHSDSGFRNTLAFLFPEAQPGELPPPPGKFDRFTSGWVVHVTNILIESASNRKKQLILGSPDAFVSLDRVRLEFVEPTKNPVEPYDLSASGTELFFRDSVGREYPLGDVNGQGRIGAGKFVLHEGTLRRDGEGGGRADVNGEMALKRPWPMTLEIRGDWQHAYLESALAAVSDARFFPGVLKLEGTLSGTALEPKLQANVNAEAAGMPFLSATNGCALNSLRAEMSLNTSRLQLSNIQADDLLSNGELQFRFDATKSFHVKSALRISPEQAFFVRCFGRAGQSEQLEVPKSLHAFGDALSSSTLELDMDGALTPVTLRGKVFSELRMKNLARRSELQADFDLANDQVHLVVKERGVTPQVQAAVDTEQVEGRGTALQTQFSVARNSLVDVSADYDLTKKHLRIEKFSFVRYPLQELIARLVPFTSEELFQRVSNVVVPSSLLNAEGKADLDFESLKYRGQGNLELSSLAVGPLQIKVIRLPFQLRDDLLSVKGVTVETPTGQLTGALDVQPGGLLSGNLDMERFPLGDLPTVSERFPDLSISASGKAFVKGNLEKPQYGATATIETFVRGVEDSKQSSTINLQGDQHSLGINADIFGKAANVALQYPLEGGDDDGIKLSATVHHLPFRYLWAGLPGQDESNAGKNELNGKLTYEGPKQDPLAGKGRLEIDTLSYMRDTVYVHNTEPLLAEIDGGRLNFTQVRLSAQRREIVLSGGIDRVRGWDATLHGEWGLGSIFRKAKILEQISGQISTELSIRGALTQPVITGPIRIRNASVSFPLANTIVGAENGVLDGYFESGNLRIDKIQARIGEGTFNGSGSVQNVLDKANLSTDIQAEFRRVVIEPADHLVTELSGKLQLTRAPSSPLTLSGDVHVEHALYENKINLPRILRAMSRYIIGNSSRARATNSTAIHPRSDSALKLNVRLFADSGAIIETNVVEAELRGDLRLKGDSDQPLLDGRISAMEGAFGFGPNEFQILSGDIIFSELRQSLDPDLSILGETTVRGQDGDEHLVRMAIRGTVLAPEVDFSSETGMSRESVLALMGLGTNLEALPGGFSRNTRSIAELLNPASNVSLQERLSGLTGFSSVQVDTVMSPSSGELVPRLVAKRPLIGDVQLDLQTELSKSQVSTVSAEYPLTPYLSLISGWRSSGITSNESRDSGNLSLGLTYRITFPGIKLVAPSLTKDQEAEQGR